jgi:hypothetical protein
MLVLQRKNKKYIVGKGFLDSLSNFANNAGSYISQNKDLILKPALGAVGSLAATGISSGIPYLINKIITKRAKNKNSDIEEEQVPVHVQHKLNEKSKEILKNILQQDAQDTNLNNIIGSGLKKKIGKPKGFALNSKKFSGKGLKVIS